MNNLFTYKLSHWSGEWTEAEEPSHLNNTVVIDI